MKPTFRKSYGPTPPPIVFVEIPKPDSSVEGMFNAIRKATQGEYLGAWTQSPEEKRLCELAREYHERTERFDQIHCKARNKRGIAIPETAGEMSICTSNAKRVYDELWIEAARLGFNRKQWQKALSNAARDIPTQTSASESPAPERTSAASTLTDVADVSVAKIVEKS